jgi:hypothetical protein
VTPARYANWSAPALAVHLSRALAICLEDVSNLGLERIGVLVGLIRAKGGAAAGELISMSTYDVLERQIDLAMEQLAVAKAMLREQRQPAQAPALAVVPKKAPMDPVREVRLLAANFVAQGLSWDQFQDRIDVNLMQAAIRQFCEFGPGRSAGRRSVEGFRKHVMDGVPGKAVA